MEITVIDTYTTGTHYYSCYTVQILNAKYLVQSASFKYAASASVFMCSTQVSHILNYCIQCPILVSMHVHEYC